MSITVAAVPAADSPKEERAKRLAKLFDALASMDQAVRDKAYNAIEKFLSDGDLDVVAKAAMDDRLQVREKAIHFLSRFKTHSPSEPPDIAAILLAGLQHKNKRVCGQAALTSMFFAGESPALLKALIKALDDHAETGFGPGDVVSQSAAMSLWHLGPKARPAYAALIRAAGESPDMKTRTTALEGLGQLGAKDKSHLPRLLGVLIDRLKKAKTADERAAAANAMRHSGADAAVAIPVLRAAFRGPDEKDFLGGGKVRNAVLAAYNGIGKDSKVALPDVLPVLRDKTVYSEDRINILWLIRTLGEDGKEAWPVMRQIEADPTEDFLVRQDASATFAALKKKK